VVAAILALDAFKCQWDL